MIVKKTWHMHSCIACWSTYGDTCETAGTNGSCNPCRTGRPSAYGGGRDPVGCCLTQARLVSKDETKIYRLAGEGPWWICRTCSRQHGYDPGRRGGL